MMQLTNLATCPSKMVSPSSASEGPCAPRAKVVDTANFGTGLGDGTVMEFEAIPEPGTWGMVGMGMIGMLAVRRRLRAMPGQGEGGKKLAAKERKRNLGGV